MSRGFGLFVGRDRSLPAPVASSSATLGYGASLLSRLARTAGLLTLLATSLLALPSPASADECPNEKFRTEQFVTGTLGQCRAYEKVSPADKGQGDIVGDGDTTVASRFGDAVAFNSRTPFGDTVGSGGIGQTQYVAQRTDDGWSVHAITPTPRPDAMQTIFAPTILQIYSEDVSAAVVRAYDLPGATDDAPLRNNLYVEDTVTRALHTVSVSHVDPLTIPDDFLQYPNPFWGISADARHIAFVTPTRFLLDAVPGVPNVYKWDDGVLSVASVLPDGTAAANGADSPTNLRGAMSADGSRLLFTASTGGNPQLFMRIDGTRTAWVSQTELDPADPNYQPDPTNVQAKGMTPDGKNVFFVTDTPLLPGDTNGGPDLYRYKDSADPSSDNNLTLISQTGDLAEMRFIGMSDDGERVYYATGDRRLVVWDHGASKVISSTFVLSEDPELGVSLTSARPGYGRVTPDGSYFAFGTTETLDGIHGPTGEVTNGHLEMYLYSLGDHTLRCVSCPSHSATSDATVLPKVTFGNPTLSNGGFRPRFLSDSGHVFFSTAEGLVPQDTNGVLDAYDYDPATGRVSLVSTGKGKDPATFADASASGDDVFLVTRQRLVSSDRDDLVDLYDVRVNGGFPQGQTVSPAPCLEEVCQGSHSAAPEFQTPSSVSFAGSGNLKPVATPKPVKHLSRAQRLKKALKACKGKHKRAQRKKCDSAARRRFVRSRGV
jgi:WD40-like Beta Propeller Repeat